MQLFCTSASIAIATMLLDQESAAMFAQNYATLILVISEIATLGILVLICKWQRKKASAYLGEDNAFYSKSTLPIVIAGIFGNIFTSAFMNLLPFSQETIDNYSNSVGALTSSLLIADIIAVAVLAPIVEEVIFRGLVFSRLRCAIPVWAAIAVQAIIFGLIHGNFLWVIYAAIFGAVLGYVRYISGSVKASIIMHIAFNAASFFVAIIFMSLPETRAMQAIIAMVSGIIMIFAISKIKTVQ